MSIVTTEQLKNQAEESSIGGIWERIKEKLEFAQYQPKIVENVEISKLSGRHGTYYIVKNTRERTYYRLDEQDHFLWSQMDGTHSVKDMVVSYFMKYGTFAFARAGSLVQGLKERNFLTDHPAHVYSQVEEALSQRQASYRLQKALTVFTGKQLALNHIDGAIDTLYRRGGWVLFTKPVQILLFIIIILGLFLFAGFVRSGNYSLSYTGDSLVLGIIILFVLNSFSILLHELSHGLTVKHFGRQVRRGGFLLYYGMPAFFVDTTDIWMQPKKARIAVSWGGPQGTLVLAGLAAILMALSPWPAVNGLLYIFAFVSFVGVFLNLNPLLELDGYFILMDWLEIPMLRAKSLGFIRTGLWSRLLGAAGDSGSRLGTFFSKNFWSALTREERLFAVFGLLSAVWTVAASVFSVRYWQRRVGGSLVQLWYGGSTATRLLLALAGLAVVAVVFLVIVRMARPYVRRLFRWIRQKASFAGAWRIAMILVVCSVLVAWTPSLLSQPLVSYGISALALATGGLLAWQNAEYVEGARQSRAFVLMTLFSAVSLLATLLLLANRIGSAGGVPILLLTGLLTLFGALAVLLAAFVLTQVEGIRAQPRPVQAALIVGVIAAFAAALLLGGRSAWAVPAEWLDFVTLLAPLVAVALLIPTVVSTWRTDFTPAWIILALALGLLAFGMKFETPPTLAFLLTAVAMFLYRAAHDRVNYRPERAATGYPSNDQMLLTQACEWAFEGLIVQHQALAGRHRSQRLIERFNKYAATTHWRTGIVAGQMESNLPPDVTLPERGRSYGAALTLFLDLMKLDVGDKPAFLALERSYDALPWENREIASIYAFSHVEQAHALGTKFQSLRTVNAELLRHISVLASVSDKEIELIASRLISRHLATGEVFIKQGDSGDGLYIIRSGLVEVSVQDNNGYARVVGRLSRGSYVGETALLDDAPRNASCKAILPTEVLVLGRDDFVELVKENFQMGEKVSRSINVLGLLRQIPLFSDVDGKTLQQIAAHLEAQEYSAGSYIMRQGDIGDTFYVIESGQVEVVVTQHGEERVVNQLEAGSYVGEIALLMGVPRTASVRALTPTVALAMHRNDFERFVVKDLYANKVLELETSRRLQSQQRLFAPAPA